MKGLWGARINSPDRDQNHFNAAKPSFVALVAVVTPVVFFFGEDIKYTSGKSEIRSQPEYICALPRTTSEV